MVHDQPKPAWAPLPRPGCKNVEFRLLLQSDGLVVANLRFASHATIDEHDAPVDIDVICIDGAGKMSIGNAEFDLRAGQTARWPKNTDHRLWTLDSTMETIMVERYDT